MKLSEYYKLGQTQATLDFIDVAIEGDTNAYIEPRAIRRLEDDWAKGAWGCFKTSSTTSSMPSERATKNAATTFSMGSASRTRPISECPPRSRGDSSLGPGLIEKVWNRLDGERGSQNGIAQRP